MTSVAIVECNLPIGKDRSDIPFGVSEVDKVCGTIEGEAKSLDKSEEYTRLFTEKGGVSDSQWNSSKSYGKGTSQCIESDISYQWATFGSSYDFGTKYLGLCEDVGVENTKFVKKVQNQLGVENSEEGTLGICDGECGSPDEGSSFFGTPRILQEKEVVVERKLDFIRVRW